MHGRYKNQAAFLSVYVREAHPSEAGEFDIPQPTTFDERVEVAKVCSSTLKMTMPLVVDTLDDRVMNAYRANPDRLYIIDADGKIVYRGGRGPQGFRPEEMEQHLVMLLLESSHGRKSAR